MLFSCSTPDLGLNIKPTRISLQVGSDGLRGLFRGKGSYAWRHGLNSRPALT
jgi:hypothetical protein